MATTRPPLFVDVRLRKPKAAQVKPNNESPPGPMGNTVGIVVPDTAPAPHAGSAPPIKPTPAEKGWWGSWGSDVAHGALDLAGLIPGVGTITEGINAGIYVAEGDYVNAAISAAGMIPGAGDAAIAGRYAKKGAQAVLKQGEKQAAEAAAKQLEKKAAKEAEEAAAKKAAKEAEEAAAKKAEGKGGGNDRKNCKPLQNGLPGVGYRGGRHGNIKKGGKSYDPGRESHHMPADSAYERINGSPVASDSKPAIQMDKVDHEKTASWGNSKAAEAYRNTQSALIKQGKAGYLASMMMDVADVKSKFGSKYDGAILQMMAWAKCMRYI